MKNSNAVVVLGQENHDGAKFETACGEHSTIRCRDYQAAALKAIDAALSRGIRRQLISLPTGSGKTVIFSMLIQRRGGRVLVLVHRDELARQAEEKIRLVIPGAHIGIVKAERNEVDATIVIASVQTLARQARREQIAQDFGTVIVDEAHHSAADSYRDVLCHVGAFHDAGPLVAGFTATPDRADGQGLDSVFQEIVYQKNILEMIEAGYLCDMRAMQIQLKADFGQLHTRGGDFIEAETAAMLMDAGAPGHAVRAYQEHALGRPAILFTPTVDLARIMASVFAENHISSESLDASTPIQERREMLMRFRTGETVMLANCGVLTEGFDEPRAACIIVARPTKSRGLYVQMIGRGSRPFPGKEDCLILDLVGTTTRHDLMTTASLFGVNPREMAAGRTVTEAVASQEKLKLEPQRSAEGHLIASAIDLFNKAKFHWVRSDTAYTLTIGAAGMIILKPDSVGEKWTALLYTSDRTTRTIAANLPLSYAQGTAEDYARKVGAAVLADRFAPWRQKPATSRQRVALRKFKVRTHANPALTAGEASDLLTSAIVARRG